MNIILFGPQGSGKGTQAKLLAEKFGFFYFEAGAYLRKIAETNEVVRKAQLAGKFDGQINEEICTNLEAYFDEKNLYDDILFDGFPRSLDQYLFLKKWLIKKQVKVDLCIVLEISENETLKRLLLRKRDDDTPEAIKKRLAFYETQTKILIDEIKKDSKVVMVDGERSIEDIQKDLVELIENAKN